MLKPDFLCKFSNNDNLYSSFSSKKINLFNLKRSMLFPLSLSLYINVFLMSLTFGGIDFLGKQTVETALISVKMGNKVSDMHADIADLEKELQEMKALRHNSPRIANRIEAMETVIARMKNSVKYFQKGVIELSRSDGVIGNGNGNRARGFCDWFTENFSVIISCFGMSLGEENVRSPLITERMIGSINIASDIEGLGKKSFLKWLNYHEHDQSDKEWESTLMRLKEGLILLGIRLSHQLLDFFFLASERGDNMAIFDDFRKILGSRIHEDYRTLVMVKKVLKLVEMAERVVTYLKNKGKEISKEEISADSVKQTEDSVHDIADNFCWQILTLHLLVSRDFLEKSVLVEKMEEGFGEVKEELNKIEQDIGKLRVQLPSSVKEDLQTVEARQRQLESKVRELWSGFGLDQREDYEQRSVTEAKFQ